MGRNLENSTKLIVRFQNLDLSASNGDDKYLINLSNTTSYDYQTGLYFSTNAGVNNRWVQTIKQSNGQVDNTKGWGKNPAVPADDLLTGTIDQTWFIKDGETNGVAYGGSLEISMELFTETQKLRTIVKGYLPNHNDWNVPNFISTSPLMDCDWSVLPRYRRFGHFNNSLIVFANPDENPRVTNIVDTLWQYPENVRTDDRWFK